MSKGAVNRQRIVEAARELFYRYGYATTSFSEIASLAGIPRGNFYYYFKSKDEILAEVVRARQEALSGQFKQWDVSISCPRERLLRFVSMPLQDKDNLIRYGCPMGSLISEMCKSDTKSSTEVASLFDCVIQWLGMQLTQLGYEQESHKMAMHMFGRVQGATILCNAYRDSSCLHYEVGKLREWIESL